MAYYNYVFAEPIRIVKQTVTSPGYSNLDEQEVWIDLEETEGQLHIHIIDAGQGFNVEALRAQPQASTGFGLGGMKKRLGYFGCRIDLSSKLGAGTRATIAIPVTPEQDYESIEEKPPVRTGFPLNEVR